ncbi:potassium-transporting ATPase subunit KdpC [Clostridium perfringens]|uniref:Potassium-transporting ATPase KdpC subunit n=1 Tax=Clostridium perfringens TaxID=1502 RepID=A0A127EHM4_CLOPF|nr:MULTISPECIES: potassium-transporting ATPase subunit KdpC [Clostridium]AMN35423.1 potassium-transporting ATPase subunit C [Clostridium perfringens]MDK7589796.1 potassium-transporting ATPase subunit KdpC [Clostridium sp. UMB9555B]MDK7627811.1 potassium-transporting ATPase subunit KdpC [Clostridium sp. UMB9555A]
MKIIRKSILAVLIFTILCGIIYPVSTTVLAQVLFKEEANGSIIEVDGKKYGSELLGQQFTDNKYLWGRIMNINVEMFKDSNGNPLMYSSPSNLSPASEEYEKLVKERVERIRSYNKGKKEEPIPVDLVTSSGSGLDPHISVAAAKYQVDRIAKERNLSVDYVNEIIDKYTTGRLLGVFGEKTVNVLKVNLALDGILRE